MNKFPQYQWRQAAEKVAIDAYQLPPAGQDVPEGFHDWCEHVGFDDFTSERDGELSFGDGEWTACPGDWIVKDQHGRFCAMGPEDFERSCEPAPTPMPSYVPPTKQAQVSDFMNRHFSHLKTGRLEYTEAEVRSIMLGMSHLLRLDTTAMRNVLSAVQHGECSVSRALECLEAIQAGSTALEVLPPFEGYFGEDEVPIEVVKALRDEPRYTLDQISAACWEAEVFDSKFERIELALQKEKP